MARLAAEDAAEVGGNELRQPNRASPLIGAQRTFLAFQLHAKLDILTAWAPFSYLRVLSPVLAQPVVLEDNNRRIAACLRVAALLSVAS